MALPAQLKSARMTNDTLGINIDDNVGDLEQVLCDIFGFTIDSNVTESPLSCDNSGRITKNLLRLKASGTQGIRYLESGSGKEFRLANDGTYLTIDENTGTESSPVWTNRAKMAITTGVWTFTAIPVGPASSPTADNELARKKYVDDEIDTLDAAVVHDTGAESIAGVKTFGSFPVTPSSAPTTDYQVANKKYVDDEIDAANFSPSVAILQNRQTSGTDGGSVTAGAWYDYPLNVEYEDADGIVDFSSPPTFSLDAGTYRIKALVLLYNCNGGKIQLYNVDTTSIQQNINSKDMVGSVCDSGSTSNDSTVSNILGTFTISTTTAFKIRFRTGLNKPNGLGAANNFGVDEVYGQVEIAKVA